MNIYGSTPRLIDRVSSAAGGGGSTYALANNVRADEARHGKSDVDAARNTALSALKNDRFGLMLSKISEPGASGALMTMKRDAGSAGADFNSVLSSYADTFE